MYIKPYKTYLFRELECITCGSLKKPLFINKLKLPTCKKCKKSFKLWQVLITLLTILSIVALGFTIFMVYLYESASPTQFNFKYIVLGLSILASLTILFLIVLGIVIMLRKKAGIHPKQSIKYENGFYVKTKKMTDWILLQEWLEKILIKKDHPKEKVDDFTEAMIQFQFKIKERYNKKGLKIMVLGGIVFVFMGLLGLIGGLTGEREHSVITLSSIAMGLGVLIIVYGSRLGKTMY
ncbi:MAG: hypothetical protein ACFFG0_06380 [Candidatus Thorarchaeota archaeon]